MRRFFGRKQNDKIIIENDDFKHLKNVLRLGVGAEVIVSLNDEFEYICEIEKFEKNFAVCKVNGKNECPGNPKKEIVLFQAITKGPKFEFIVQKATEIGITTVVPFLSEYCVAKISEHKKERLESIIENACKQCERTIKTKVCNVRKVDDVVNAFSDFDLVLFANERENAGEKIKNLEKYNKIAIIVGSEGGFSQKEKEKFIDAGAASISLGKRIFRAETASVAMMSLVSILSGN